jgi:hypothetical protein
VQEIKGIAKKWFRSYKGEYGRVSLFELEDLEQEIWASIFESDGNSKERFLTIAENTADKMRKKGGRLPVEIPISQLPRKERIAMNNLFYGAGGDSDDYSEESFP